MLHVKDAMGKVFTSFSYQAKNENCSLLKTLHCGSPIPMKSSIKISTKQIIMNSQYRLDL